MDKVSQSKYKNDRKLILVSFCRSRADRGREPDLFRSGASAWRDRDGVEEPGASARHSGGVREQREAAQPVQVTAKRSKLR